MQINNPRQYRPDESGTVAFRVRASAPGGSVLSDIVTVTIEAAPAVDIAGLQNVSTFGALTAALDQAQAVDIVGAANLSTFGSVVVDTSDAVLIQVAGVVNVSTFGVVSAAESGVQAVGVTGVLNVNGFGVLDLAVEDAQGIAIVGLQNVSGFGDLVIAESGAQTVDVAAHQNVTSFGTLEAAITSVQSVDVVGMQNVSSFGALTVASLLPTESQWTASSAQTPPADPWKTFVSVDAGYTRPAGYKISFGHDELYKHPNGPPASRMGPVGPDPLGFTGGSTYTSTGSRKPQDWSTPSIVRVRLALVPEGLDHNVEANIVEDVTKDFVNYYQLAAGTRVTSSGPEGQAIGIPLRKYTDEAGQTNEGVFDGGAPDFATSFGAGATNWSIVTVDGVEYVQLSSAGAVAGDQSVNITATDADHPAGITQTVTMTIGASLTVTISGLQAIVETTAADFSLEFADGDFAGRTATVTKADATSAPIVVFAPWIADGEIKGLLYSLDSDALSYSIVWYDSGDQVIPGETTRTQPAGGVRAQVSATDANGTLGPLDVYDLLASAPSTFSSTTATDPATYDVSTLISGGVAPYAYAIVSDATGACTINSSTGVLSIAGAEASGDVVVRVTAANTDTVDVTVPVSRTAAAGNLWSQPGGAVILVGASLDQRAMNGAPGGGDGNHAARWAHVLDSFSNQLGFQGTLHNEAVGSQRFTDTVNQIGTFAGNYPNDGTVLAVVHRSGNDTTDRRPWSSNGTYTEAQQQAFFDSGLASVDAALPANWDRVNVTITKRTYTAAPVVPYNGVDTDGSKPFNDNSVIPFIQANQPNWLEGGLPAIDGYSLTERLDAHLSSPGAGYIGDGTHLNSYAEHLFVEWQLWRVATFKELFTPVSASGKSILLSIQQAAGFNAGGGYNYLPAANYALRAGDGTRLPGAACEIHKWGVVRAPADAAIEPTPTFGDARFGPLVVTSAYGSANNPQQFQQPTGTIRFYLPGSESATGTARFAGSRNLTGSTRKTNITHGGNTVALDASSDAAANDISLAFTVGANGILDFGLSVPNGTGYLSAIILDFN